jgi:hypothetical protein
MIHSKSGKRWDISNRTLYPDMTRWFSPGLLLRLLFKVIVSDTFGQYADRRLMIAALDTVDAQEHLNRATQVQNELKAHLDEEGALWVDFVADLGDGFDSTYAIGTLLASSITVGDCVLPPGQLLIMGGDEVYPTASRETYTYQLHDPYELARPDPNKKEDQGPPVYAIPGNHDWYDGLVMFIALFCKEKPWHLGAWRSRQRRSYFALQLTDTWWIWATDIQLADNMDEPQADYFKLIAAHMPTNSKVILCSAEPGWLYTNTNRPSWEIVDYAAGIASATEKNITFPIFLSGDTHHYSRYATADGKQFITSGGGGAFLHPTHQLADDVDLKWQGKREKLALCTDPMDPRKEGPPACYPSREQSRALLRGNLAFPFTNADFACLMGAIYWLLGLAYIARPLWDVTIIISLIFCATLVSYTRYQEKSDHAKIYLTSILHGLAHTAALLLVISFFMRLNASVFDFSGTYGLWWAVFVYALELGVIGGFIGAFIFGLNLLFTCRWFDMNHNDAFSAMRLNSYKNFLRLRIRGEEVTVFAIGLDQIPERSEWIDTQVHQGQPRYQPKVPLAPRLLEKVAIAPVGPTSDSTGPEVPLHQA